MLPDFMESLEAAAEKRFDELEYNPNDDTCKCIECGERHFVPSMSPVSAHPFSMLICRNCCDPGEQS